MRSEDAVLDLLTRGWTHKEIAQEMALSPFTVGHIASGLMHRQGVATERRLIAAVWAARCTEQAATIVRLTAVLAVIGRRSSDHPSI